MLMKNKILSKAYGGVTVARRKLYGLGLPRQWKVITSTLLLLFTFAIGNVLAADPQDTYYKFTTTASANASIGPVSGDGGNIVLGSNSAAKITAQSAWYMGATYSHAININNSDAKAFSLPITASTENPAHVFVLVTSDTRTLKLKYGSSDVDLCGVRGTAGTSSYTAAAALVELVTTNSGSHVIYASGSGFVYAVRVVYEKNALWQEIKGLSDVTLDKDKTLADDLSTLYFFRMQDFCFNTDGVISAGGAVANGLRYSINFKAQRNGEVTVNYANPGGSNRNLTVTELTRPTTPGTSIVNQSVAKNTTTYADKKFDVVAGKEYVVGFNGAGATIKSINFKAAAPKYDVIFANGGEGTGDMATLKYEAGEEVTLPACGYTPVSGREFNGWTSSDVTISAGKFEMPAKNVTITATWRDEAVKYTVTYDVNGGSSATPTETDKAAGDEFALAAAPEYDGYHFEGWLCDVDAVTYDAEDAYTMTAANTTFTAQWKPYSTISIANKTYIIGIGDFNAVSDFSSNSDGAMSYALKEAYTGVTLSSAGVFSATVAGDYIVVANQAANATYAATSKEFTVTVLDSELSDIYIWQKNADHGGDGKCVTSAQANQNVNANQASTTLDYSKLVMDGMSAMGRPASPSTVTLTFSVKDAYKSSFGITNVCVYGKIEEAGGLEYSWNNVDWTAVAGGESGNNKHEFTAPAGTYAENFYIRFTNAEAGKGGLWFRNTLVTLEAKKTVTGVTEALVGAEINGAAISSENLATLLASKTLAIATAYAAAPTVTFKKEVTTTYAGGWAPDVENVDVEVTASDNTTDWQASATINAQEYTITLAKPTAPSLETEATAFTLTSAKIATDTKSFTFSGINLTSSNVTIALESPVAGMTVTPAEVTPVAGVITDQEVTITYKSLEDVATANVNLVVYYDADTKIVLPLTYSSTKGYEDLTSISAATTWNWDGAASAAYGTLGQNDMIILANADVTWDDDFNARAIAGKLQHYYRDGKYAQGLGLKFHTTIQGIVEVTYSNTGGNAARTVNVNGVKGTLSSSNNKEEDKRTESFNVSAGDVLIKGVLVSDDSDQMLRFYEVSFVPTYIVNYWPGEGTGATIVDDNATVVADCPGTFTAPTGKMFYGWKDGENNDVAVGATVTKDMVLTAQWGDIMVAKIGDDMYPSLEAALLHAADGEIVLLQDIDVTSQIEIADGVTATIDLAGHKIEYTGSTTLSSGVILVHNGGTLTINDSSDPDAGSVVAGEKAYAALMLTKAGDDASKVANLTINGGSFTGYYYAISGNGNRPNTNITINGGTLNATATNDNLGIYHPQNGTLTINGGTITGYASAIEMRAGTLVINDGTFTATATTYSCNPNGSGTTTVGAAIAIAQHTTKKDIEVTINGGTFEGEKALNESNPQANDPAPQVTMAVTGGNFTGEVSTVDVDKFVSGGTFNHPVLEEQCAEGYMPKDNGGGSYGVQYAGVIRGAAVKETIGEDEIPMYTLDNGVKIYSSGSNGQVSTSSNFSTGSDVEVCGGDAGKYAFTSQHMILKFPKNVSGFKIFGTGSTQRSINKVYSNATAGTDVQIKNVGVEHTGTFTGDKEQTAGKWCQYVEAVFDANNTIAKDEYVYVNLNGSMYAYRVIFTEAECTDPVINSTNAIRAKVGEEATVSVDATAIGTSYAWYRCDDELGTHPQLIEGATKASYKFTKAAGNEYFKVVVGCNCSEETVEAIITAEEWYQVDRVNVTGYTEWNWAGVYDDADQGPRINETVKGLVLASYIDAPNFNKLEGNNNAYVYRKNQYPAYQGTSLKFTTEIPGMLIIDASYQDSGNEITVNGNNLGALPKNHAADFKIAVPAGDVTITSAGMRIWAMTFDPDFSNYEVAVNHFNGYTRDVTEGRYGTICLPNGGIMVGATLYEVAYYGATSEKIFFDEILNGTMVAGVPYIYLPNEGADKLAVFYTDEANESAKSANGLVGYIGASENTSDALPVPHNDGNYILNNNQYREVVSANSAYILSHRAYIHLAGITPSEPALAPGRRRISMSVYSEQVATGIENTGFESEAPRKVLINGELYIIRGEKMYDAKGQLVK